MIHSIQSRSRYLLGALALGTLMLPALAHAEYDGLPCTFIWNPDITEMVDTTPFKKDGPYRIGFANASQADLWLVTFARASSIRPRSAST